MNQLQLDIERMKTRLYEQIIEIKNKLQLRLQKAREQFNV